MKLKSYYFIFLVTFSSGVLNSCNNKKDIDNNFIKNFIFETTSSNKLNVSLTSLDSKLTGTITNANDEIIHIDGEVHNNEIKLNEYDGKGNITGIYIGSIEGAQINGYWAKPNGSNRVNFTWIEGMAVFTTEDKKKIDDKKIGIPINVPKEYHGNWSVNCDYSPIIKIGNNNPIDIMVISNQINVSANAVLDENDPTKLNLYLNQPKDLGKGGGNLEWENFSRSKPIGYIKLSSSEPSFIFVSWIGFYNESSDEYDWPTSDFGNHSTMINCENSPRQIKNELLEAERKSPTSFLKAKGTYRKRFGKYTIDITVSNTATLATYKDIVIKVDYYTKTNTLLLSKNRNNYDFYYPGKSKTFTWSLPEAPTNAEIIRLSIVSAK